MGRLVDLIHGLNNWPRAFGFLSSVVTVMGGLIVMLQMVLKTVHHDHHAHEEGDLNHVHKLDGELEILHRQLDGVRRTVANVIPLQVKNLEDQLGDIKERIKAMQVRLERLADVMILHYQRKSPELAASV